MIFLDNDDQWFVTSTRREMISALLDSLDWDTVDLAELAAVCLDCDTLDIVVVEEDL